jgi:hypothetical protein
VSDLAAGLAELYKQKQKNEAPVSIIPGTAAANIQAGQAAVPAPQIATNQGGAQAAIENANPKPILTTQPEGGGIGNLESQKKDITKDRPELYDKNVEYSRNTPDAITIAAKQKPAGTTDGSEVAQTQAKPSPQVVQAAIQSEATQAKREGRGINWQGLAGLGITLADLVEAWAKGQTGDTRKLGWEERRDIKNDQAQKDAELAFTEKLAKAQQDFQVNRDNARNAQEMQLANMTFAHQKALAQQELGAKGGLAGSKPGDYYGTGQTATGGQAYVDPAALVAQYNASQQPKVQATAQPVPGQVNKYLTPEQQALVDSQRGR